MTIGIVTEPESYPRKHFFKKLFKIYWIEKISNTKNPFEVVLAVLPSAPDRLKNISSARLEKKVARLAKKLKKLGTTELLLSDFLFNLCKERQIDTSKFANGRGKKLFLSLMPLCVRQITKKSGIDLFSSSVCIMDTKMDRISEYLIRELCFDTKKLYIYTKNLPMAHMFCENFCDETGLWLEVFSEFGCRCDILLDVDNGQIKIGNDLFVRDAKFDFDFGGYSICETDAAALVKNVDFSHISWVYNYGK